MFRGVDVVVSVFSICMCVGFLSCFEGLVIYGGMLGWL